jgi:aminopeptidase N
MKLENITAEQFDTWIEKTTSPAEKLDDEWLEKTAIAMQTMKSMPSLHNYLAQVALVQKLLGKSVADAVFTFGVCLGIEFAVDLAESEKLEASVCPISQ